MTSRRREPQPVVKGTLDVLVLKALTDGPMHGFALTSALEARSGGRLGLEDAALYQALYRMEQRGLVSADWGTSDRGRRARFYRLTAKGRRHLARQTAEWLRYADTVTDILTGRGGTTG